MAGYQGVVWADTATVRFAFSGKVATVVKKIGDQVKKGELLASLNKHILQIELDRQLADYERTRADFELFNLKYKEDTNDVTKYLRVSQQAALNASVKEVELAKLKLDQADLFSPVTGLVTDTGGNYPGLYVTPSANSFIIQDLSSICIRLEIGSDDISKFVQPVSVRVEVQDQSLPGRTRLPIPARSDKFLITVDLTTPEHLTPGLPCRVFISTSSQNSHSP